MKHTISNERWTLDTNIDPSTIGLKTACVGFSSFYTAEDMILNMFNKILYLPKDVNCSIVRGNC